VIPNHFDDSGPAELNMKVFLHEGILR